MITEEELIRGYNEAPEPRLKYGQWCHKKGAEDDVRIGGVYECFHCLSRSVVWQSDFDFSDYGYEGEGIVHFCTCANCGAEIEYRIPLGGEKD